MKLRIIVPVTFSLAEIVAAGNEMLPQRFNAVLAIEGQETGDGRYVVPGALSWRELPLPLTNAQDTGDDHAGAVIGKIDSLRRVGNEILADGEFDLGSDAGLEAARLVSEQIKRWVSMDVDMVEGDFVKTDPSCVEDDAEDLLLLLAAGGGGCDYRFELSSGRIMGAAIVAFPAFPGAVIVPEGASIPSATQNGRPESEAPTVTATASPTAWDGTNPFIQLGGRFFVEGFASVTDKTWDGAASRFDDDQWKRATAACEGKSDAPKTDCYLPHHEPDGTINSNGVHAAAGRISQTKRANVSKASSHLASHYKNDLKEDVPDSLKASIEASDEPCDECADGLLAGAPLAPPAEWFTDPELKEPTPMTIADDGHIFGHAARWGECHIGYGQACVTPPPSFHQYAYFRTGSLRTADGVDVQIGCITLGTGHAKMSAPPRAAAEHYDDTGAIAAFVACGEDAFGIWFSGAVRSDLEPERLRDLRASAVSGDWREIAGTLELVAMLAVPVPGFPVVRGHIAASGRQSALVAAGAVLPTDEQVSRIAALEKRNEALERMLDPLVPLAAERLRQKIKQQG